MSFFTSVHFDTISFILGLVIGLLSGMGVLSTLIGNYGCYQGCHLQTRSNDDG